MDILLLLLLLQIKHWYADFGLQTYMQTVTKGVWLHPVGVSHSLEHVWSTLIALTIFSLFVTIEPLVIGSVAIVEGFIHYIIDFTKVKYGIKDITKSLFWNQFGLDQFAHQFTYLCMAAYILL